MDTLILDRTGYGAEEENWICDQYGKPVMRLQDTTAYLALRREMQQILGKDPECLSAELLGCQAELKTGVHASAKEVIEELEYHSNIANLALHNIDPNLRLESVAYKNMDGIELVAADPSAPSYQRVLDWSQTANGRELLRKTAICSTQLCVSDGLENLNAQQKRQLLARCYGFLSDNYGVIQELNANSPRLGIIEELIISVKKDNFDKLGLLAESGRDETFITRPNNMNEADLIAWYMAHSGVLKAEDIKSKDAHGLLLKGKMITGTMDLGCFEHRWADASPDRQNVIANIYAMHHRMMDSCN